MRRSNDCVSVRQVRLALRTLGMLGLLILTAQAWSEEAQSAAKLGVAGRLFAKLKHPYLYFTEQEIPRLRERIQKPPYA